MVTIDATSVAAVALVVTVTAIIYYHFIFFYSVKQKVFNNVRASLESLWNNRIVENNPIYFNADLPKTVAIVDAYNRTIHPYVQRGVGVLQTDEQGCNKQTAVTLTVYEVILVISLAALLLLAVSFDIAVNTV